MYGIRVDRQLIDLSLGAEAKVDFLFAIAVCNGSMNTIKRTKGILVLAYIHILIGIFTVVSADNAFSR